MRLRLPLAVGLAVVASITAASADSPTFKVQPRTFDPAKTFLVQAAWSDGIGCPTNARVATYPSNTKTGTYTDTACAAPGEPNDPRNQGLLLAKTGPTSNNASAVADLKNVKAITLTELGYDIRKTSGAPGPLGSHCGAGAPRFNVDTTAGSWFIGCQSPPPDSDLIGNGFSRLRWGTLTPLKGFDQNFVLTPITGTVTKIQIVLDEGQDTGPDFFGLAVLDNIDVNGQLVGQGPTSHEDEHDRPKDEKDKHKND